MPSIYTLKLVIFSLDTRISKIEFCLTDIWSSREACLRDMTGLLDKILATIGINTRKKPEEIQVDDNH